VPADRRSPGARGPAADDVRPSSPHRSAIARLLAAGCLAVIAVGLAELSLHHPSTLAMAPRCAFRLATGLRCPGCGLMRATHHLLRGQVGAAVRLNPLAPALPFVLGWVVWVAVATLVRGEPPRMKGPPVVVGWALLAVFLALWSVRLAHDLPVLFRGA